jgi:hypothetical protein
MWARRAIRRRHELLEALAACPALELVDWHQGEDRRGGKLLLAA